MNKNSDITPLNHETYLAVIRKSVGSEMFQSLYACTDGEKKDITQGGALSCAFFVSSILKMFDLIETLHATVEGTVRDLERSGWGKVSEPAVGDVLVWEAQRGNDDLVHKHIGFYIGDEQAISNSATEKRIVKHHMTFDGTREIEIIFHKNTVN